MVNDFTRLVEIFQSQKNLAKSTAPIDFNTRKAKLLSLKQAVIRNEARLCQALSNDFGYRSEFEISMVEILPTLQNLAYTLKHLKQWLRPEKRKISILFQPAKAKIYYQALGVIGIMVPWNYPISLTLIPLIAAIAAGNRVMIKISEYSEQTAVVLKDLLADVFSETEVAVFCGEVEFSKKFTELAFDHLFFTGSGQIAKSVMQAAAKNLIPVTLELGGKCPSIVTKNIKLADVANRIIFGKLMNASQTCVTTDFILCDESIKADFIEALKNSARKQFPTFLNNKDYGCIINQKQKARLENYLIDAKNKGGEIIELNPTQEDFSNSNKLPLYILDQVSTDMLVMQEEIFGPLLPIISFKSADEAIQFLNKMPAPLALYVFSNDRAEQEKFILETRAGGMCINDTILQAGQQDLPFGGVGHSGIGQYHAKAGFLNFSHAKSVFIKQGMNSTRLFYPPYGTTLQKLILKFYRKLI